MESALLQGMPWVGVLGMVIAVFTFNAVKKHSPGNEVMQKIAHRVYVGAMMFLKREYTIISIFMVVVFIALSMMLSVWTGVAYLAGALFSMFAGWFGMQAATRTSAPTTQAAKDGGTSAALAIAFQGGSVMGITVASLGVVGIGFLFLFLKDDPIGAPLVINGFALGASIIRAVAPQRRAISSMMTEAARSPKPQPPYSVGMKMPRKPSSASWATSGRGMSASRSHCLAFGAMCSVAQRRVIPMESDLGVINVKVKYLGEVAVGAAPEFEDCRRIALERGVPLQDVYQQASAEARRQFLT